MPSIFLDIRSLSLTMSIQDTASVSTGTYLYQHLTETDSIRLLLLHPGTEGAIHCSLSRYIPVKGLSVASLPLIGPERAEHLGIRTWARPASMIEDNHQYNQLPSCLYAPPVNLDTALYTRLFLSAVLNSWITMLFFPTSGVT